MKQTIFPDPREVLDLTVNDLLQKWPAAVQVFLTFRLGCIGCVYNGFDTLREALEVQKVDEEQFINSLLSTIWETKNFQLDESEGETP